MEVFSEAKPLAITIKARRFCRFSTSTSERGQALLLNDVNVMLFLYLISILLLVKLSVQNEIQVTFLNRPENCELCLSFSNFTLMKCLAEFENVWVRIGEIYSFNCSDNTLLNDIQIFPGQHLYRLDEQTGIISQPIVRVVSTYGALYCPGRFHFEPVWRDAIRTSAAINNFSLCFCGAGNTSTTYSNIRPNLFNPTIIFPPQCACENDTNLRYDFLLPCHHGSPPGSFRGSAPKNDVFTLTNCSLFTEKQDETRVFWINDVCHGWGRLCFKSRLWYALRTFYGLEKAKLIMPRSYDMKICKETDSYCERDELELEKEENSQFSVKRSVYIVKNPSLHKQQGIIISTTEEILRKTHSNQQHQQGYSFVTEYISEPYLVQNFKINMRRYVLLVCTGKRMRAYVHKNGKNFYGKESFSEPWDESNEMKWIDDEEKMSKLLNGIVTTGYNLTRAHETLPVTSRDFIRELLLNNEERFESFRKSMHVRLALAIHMAATSFSLPRERSRYLCEPHETPSCLLNAIRFIHIGCDFQVDKQLSGENSRLFECNLSPDMHIRDEKDGSIKKEIANDFLSFIGFQGPLNDSEENLRKYQLYNIYDAATFNEKESFDYLILQKEDESFFESDLK